MEAPSLSAPETPRALSDLFSKLHKTDIQRLSGISELLRVYAEHFAAYGVILWEIFEDLPLDAPEARLFVQARYFADRDHPPFYRLPTDSITGRCLQDNQPIWHSRDEAGNWHSTPNVSHGPALDSLSIGSFVSVPLKLDSNSKLPADAAVTFYWKDRHFAGQEPAEIRRAAELLPALYRAIQDRVSLAVIRQVQGILRNARFPEPLVRSSEAARKAMQQVINVIAHHFQFVEATIYLHDPSTDLPGSFRLMAKIWEWSKPALDVYRLGDGGTGWVLQNGEVLRLLDMASYEADQSYYRKRYPGMQWSDRVGIREVVQKYFNLPDGEMFPLSYACVPIIYKGTTTGALRCCISRDGPYHVDQDILEVLASTGELIADWWDHWTREHQQYIERVTSDSAMGLIGFANRTIVGQLQMEEPDMRKVFSDFLEMTGRAVPQADVIQIWLQEPAKTGPLVLKNPNADEITVELADPESKPDSRRAAERAPARSAFRYTFENRAVLHIDSVATSPYAPPAEPAVVSFTVAPIRMWQRSQGVLYFASTNRTPWPRMISNAASIFADQLALYLAIFHQMNGLRTARRQLEKSVTEQGQMFLDFQHQLRTPINIAKNSADRLRDSESLGTVRETAMSALIASTRRARTVANNLGFFVSLAQGRLITTRIEKLAVNSVLDAIQHACQFLYTKGALRREVEFKVDREQSVPLPQFLGDQNLIELVVDNLLDNAVKYSYKGTTITISASAALYGKEVFFYFRNKGLPIASGDIPRLRERGVRGDRAKDSSPEGTGIGLWMVAKIMEVSGGRLEIYPTDSDGFNEFRIYFKGASA